MEVNLEEFFIMVTSAILFTISVCILIGFRSISNGSNNHDKFAETIINLILVTIILCFGILIKLRVPLEGFDINYYLALFGSILLLVTLMYLLKTKHNMYKKVKKRKGYYFTLITGILLVVITELFIKDNNILFRLILVYYVIAHIHLFRYGYHKMYRKHIIGIYLMTFALIVTVFLGLLVLKTQDIIVLYMISSTQVISIIGFMLFFTSININQLYITQKELERKNDEVMQLSDDLKESVLIDNTTGLGTKFNFSIESKQLEHIKSIALINIRSFMEINQLAGFEAGNKILKSIGQFIQSILKDNEMVLRYDSDQFLIVSTETPSNCKSYIESYKKDLANVDGFDLDFYGSIIPFESSIEVQEVYKMLEVGIAQAKNSKDKFYVIDEESYNNSVNDIYFVSNLRTAINNNYFKVFYQPKYSMINEEIVSYEALARWIEGDTIISPGLFIPVAEEQDLIDDISKIVIGQVFADMQSNWHKNRSISINITTDQLLDNDFLDFIKATAKKNSVRMSQIILEVTETIIDSDLDLLKASICKLKKSGFKISLDDFGSGASSLYRFAKLDFDEIKYDKAFVNAKMKDDKVRTTFEKSIELFNSYEMTIVVEGVETKEQLDSLKHLPIDQIQGFYFSKPLPLEDVRLLS
jgi:EAL domain-containing protein (putative c-di-GMP-specific phosphodiesterase class I)